MLSVDTFITQGTGDPPGNEPESASYPARPEPHLRFSGKLYFLLLARPGRGDVFPELVPDTELLKQYPLWLCVDRPARRRHLLR